MKPIPIVLAAGASSRMGRPKALLDFDGLACIQLVLGACREAGLTAAIVVTAPGGDAVRAAAASPDVTFAINEHPERGMLSSLQAGLRQLPADTPFLIFPVDFPLVPAAEVARICAAHRTGIVIPSFARRRGHPVLLDGRLAGEILALDPTASARAVIDAHAGEIIYVDAADDRVLMDMDTPEDYARCLARFRGA